ncbi:MAG: Spore germination lipase LipC [Candidatus Dichloromethanomonas elyunquensis]|nr:MAG: Spore germination lipase LipC [Candidatus Dichloromethanomonas elyunquensis]
MSLYLALGDSITTGYGVGYRYAFASLFYQKFAAVYPGMVYCNLAVNGQTTGELSRLLSNAELVFLLKQSSMITITIGSNDLLQALPFILSGSRNQQKVILRETAGNINLIGQEIRRINKDAVIKIAAIYNPLPGGRFAAYSDQSQNLIGPLNAHLARWVKKYWAELIPLDQIFKGQKRYLLNPDQIHPNRLGHLLIAQAFSENL